MTDTYKVEKLIHYAKDTRTNAKNYLNQSKRILGSAENNLNAANSILNILLKDKDDKTLYDIDLYESRLEDLQDALEMQVYNQEYTASHVKMMAGVTKLFKKGIDEEKKQKMNYTDVKKTVLNKAQQAISDLLNTLVDDEEVCYELESDVDFEKLAKLASSIVKAKPEEVTDKEINIEFKSLIDQWNALDDKLHFESVANYSESNKDAIAFDVGSALSYVNVIKVMARPV